MPDPLGPGRVLRRPRRAARRRGWLAAGRPRPALLLGMVGLLGLLGALGILGGLGVLEIHVAPPASAHSTLVTTDPVQGSQLAVAPDRVTLTFSESVGITENSVQVLDPAGDRVDVGAARHAGSDLATAVVDLQPGLAKGSYAVLWQVASADTHPVSGSFSFGVGVRAGAALAAPQTDPTTQLVHWALVVLWYAGAALLIGVAMFVAVLWPAGQSTARRAVRRLLWAGVGGSAAAVIGLYLVQGPYGQGRGMAAVAQPQLLADTFHTTTGPLLLERLAVVLLAIPVLSLWPRREPAPDGRWQTVVLAVVLSLTSSLAGHPGQQPPVWLSAGLDALHFVAATCWLGGLACLAVAFLPRAGAADLAEVLPRWSRLAMTAVATLVVTGTVQAWRQIGSVAALTGTQYGTLVGSKVAGLLVLLGLAELGRRWVRSHAAGATRRPAATLRRSVLAEVAVAVAVLGITGALVSSVPARQAFAPPLSASFQATGVDGTPITVLLDIPDTRPGVQQLHLYTYTAQGQVLAFQEVDGALVERARGLGPIRFVFDDTGPGHGTADGVAVPGEGTWTLTVQVRTDATTSYAGSVTFPVRAG